MDCKSHEECECIIRMLKAIKHYSSIDNDNLVEFCTNQYKQILDDYTHIVTTHDHNHLNYMAKTLITDNSSISCNIKNCNHTQRYFRNRENDIELKTNADNDLNFLFYRDIMDQMHCSIFHVYQMGMRLEENTQNIDDNRNMDKIRTQLRDQMKALNINDSASTYHNKYNIINKYEQNTFIDGLYRDMVCKQIPHTVIQNFSSKLKDEGYDSDALEDDHDADSMKTNITMYLQPNHYSVVKRYLHLSSLYKVSFSTGYTFYYWQQYKKSIAQHQFFANQNDHGGFTQNELYVVSKYKSIKEEILNNCIYNLAIQEFNMSMKKANAFISTDRAKALESECPIGLFYDIPDDTSISVFHLLSIILYTDWTELCTCFSSTFRKKSSYEPISSVKERNAEYRNWSKLLGETVQLFGQQGFEGDIDDEGDEEWNIENNRAKGPFFCGMSFEMVFPQFNISLCGPTSTSKQYEVANRFATDDGIIIELDNYGYLNARHLRTFSCSWLSCYSLEDEWLFIGGHRTIKISAVTLVRSKQNFEKFFDALFYFDCMVSGNMFDDEFDDDFKIKNVNNKYIALTNLIKHKMKTTEFKNNYDAYINNTFDCFVNNKKQIIIQLHVLNEPLKIFKDLLITEDNIVKPVIFDLFTSCKRIMIYATDSFGEIQYEFDLLSLLNLIQSNLSFIKLNNVQISVIGKWEYSKQKESSWIPKKFTESIKSKFIANHLNVEITENMAYYDDDDSRKEDHLTITCKI